MSTAPISSSEAIVAGSTINGQLLQLLMADDIVPGADPSYELCKVIYAYHPLGQKMAESPINIAQSQTREITVQDAPEEVIKEYEKEWTAIGADRHIHNVTRLSRIYGIAAIVLGEEQAPSDEPIDMEKIWDRSIYFNVLDPLNTSGSMVLSQIPTSPDFNKPITVRTNGQTFHRSRYQVVMNEEPLYLQYTTSAFGFVGRSVYQRALYPLKSFIRSMIADDMIATKLALLVAKQKSPGGIIDNMMAKVAGVKRALLKQAQNGQVISIDTEEGIETLNMQNVDGAGTYSRNNILKNVATAADMPAKLLDNETLVSGFGEGTEDAKNIARYIDRVRTQMAPVYAWFDNVVQYRAWNSEFFERMQKKYPEQYGNVEYRDAFSEWRANFATEWPSLLIEPESEQVNVEKTKLEAITAFLQTMLPELDPGNKARVIQWAADNIGENKLMFQHELDIDYTELTTFQEEEQERQQELKQDKLDQLSQGAGPEAEKFGRFDSQPPRLRKRHATSSLRA